MREGLKLATAIFGCLLFAINVPLIIYTVLTPEPTYYIDIVIISIVPIACLLCLVSIFL